MTFTRFLWEGIRSACLIVFYLLKMTQLKCLCTFALYTGQMPYVAIKISHIYLVDGGLCNVIYNVKFHSQETLAYLLCT